MGADSIKVTIFTFWKTTGKFRSEDISQQKHQILVINIIFTLSSIYVDYYRIYYNLFSLILWEWIKNIYPCWFLIRYLEDRVLLHAMGHHEMCFLNCMPCFSSLAWLEVCQEPPILEVLLGGSWWFLTGVLEDGVIFGIRNHHDMRLLSCLPNFISLAWLYVCQEPPSLKSYLEGVDVSWLEDGSSLTSWIIIIYDSWLMCQSTYL